VRTDTSCGLVPEAAAEAAASSVAATRLASCCAVLCCPVCPRRAMGGSVLFQDALASRLNLMAVSRQRLDDFLKAHPAQITPGGAVLCCIVLYHSAQSGVVCFFRGAGREEASALTSSA
jgi:hypothetical protein